MMAVPATQTYNPLIKENTESAVMSDNNKTL